MRVEDTFSASTDIRSGQVNRTQDPQLEPQQRVKRGGGGSDAVDVSALGSEIAKQLAVDDPQEITRVEETRQAVLAGNFNVPVLELADSIIDGALSETLLDLLLDPPVEESTS